MAGVSACRIAVVLTAGAIRGLGLRRVLARLSRVMGIGVRMSMLRLRAPLLIVVPAVTPIAGRRLGCRLLGVWARALRERMCSPLRRWGERVV